MKFDLIQTNKGLFDADFTISRMGTRIGSVAVRDWTLATTGYIQGEFAGRVFTLRRDAKLINKVTPHDPMNKYAISIDGKDAGCIFHEECKTGLFSSYFYDRLVLNDREYLRYAIGLGKDGNCSPIYVGDTQVAQFRREPEIINECYRYNLAATDQEYGLIALLCCCYSYITTCFIPGEKMTQSVRKTYSKSTNKKELQFYDPDFESRVDD